MSLPGFAGRGDERGVALISSLALVVAVAGIAGFALSRFDLSQKSARSTVSQERLANLAYLISTAVHYSDGCPDLLGIHELPLKGRDVDATFRMPASQGAPAATLKPGAKVEGFEIESVKLARGADFSASSASYPAFRGQLVVSLRALEGSLGSQRIRKTFDLAVLANAAEGRIEACGSRSLIVSRLKEVLDASPANGGGGSGPGPDDSGYEIKDGQFMYMPDFETALAPPIDRRVYQGILAVTPDQNTKLRCVRTAAPSAEANCTGKTCSVDYVETARSFRLPLVPEKPLMGVPNELVPEHPLRQIGRACAVYRGLHIDPVVFHGYTDTNFCGRGTVGRIGYSLETTEDPMLESSPESCVPADKLYARQWETTCSPGGGKNVNCSSVVEHRATYRLRPGALVVDTKSGKSVLAPDTLSKNFFAGDTPEEVMADIYNDEDPAKALATLKTYLDSYGQKCQVCTATNPFPE